MLITHSIVVDSRFVGFPSFVPVMFPFRRVIQVVLLTPRFPSALVCRQLCLPFITPLLFPIGLVVLGPLLSPFPAFFFVFAPLLALHDFLRSSDRMFAFTPNFAPFGHLITVFALFASPLYSAFFAVSPLFVPLFRSI